MTLQEGGEDNFRRVPSRLSYKVICTVEVEGRKKDGRSLMSGLQITHLLLHSH